MLLKFKIIDHNISRKPSNIRHPSSSLLLNIYCYSKHNIIKDYFNFKRL